MWGKSRCSLIIPAMNEAENLRLLLPKIPEFIDEIIVVDGNSKDQTVEVALQNKRTTKVVSQLAKGKGAALSRGFFEASGDFIFIIDADGSMDPDELSIFAEALQNGAGLAKGSRNIAGSGSHDITAFRSAGNKGLTLLANILYKQKWTDLAYGYAAFRKEILNGLEISYLDNKIASKTTHRKMSYGQGFEIETLMFCRAVQRGAIVKEVPSWEFERINGSSNLRAISDGFRALSALIFERLRSKRKIFND